MKGLFLGVPCLLSEKGMERVVEVELDASEKAALEASAQAVRTTVAELKALG
jgi:malate dehydrogenase